MTLTPKSRIVVAGAGSIGCFVGGLLASGGRSVALLGRPALVDEVNRHGLKLSELGGLQLDLSATSLEVTADPAALSTAALVLVTVKSHATAEMADLIARHAPADAVILSLQNGVDNPTILRRQIPDRSILAGIVSFNIVRTHGDRFHRGTTGNIVIECNPHGIVTLLSVPHLPIEEASDIASVQWGKLVLNLNNALNALSGLPLKAEMSDRAWRRLLALRIDEAAAVLKAEKIAAKPPTGVSLALIPKILRLPTPLFRAIAGRMLRIDPEARSSMWEDLERRRPTEIDDLQGAILRRAVGHRIACPVNKRIAELIRAAEQARAGSPRLTPDHIWPTTQ